MTLPVETYRFTTAEYHRMGDLGIIPADRRVELIRGEIVRMTPIGSRHAACVERLSARFHAALSTRAQVRTQNPVALGPFDEPEPDLVLAHPRADFYQFAHPALGEIYLIVEVADSSIEYDRDIKVPLYGQSGIDEVWIVDLTQNQIIAYRERDEERYRMAIPFGHGQDIAPLAFPDCRLAVEDILGPTQPTAA